jgi:hypothetical protein
VVVATLINLGTFLAQQHPRASTTTFAPREGSNGVSKVCRRSRGRRAVRLGHGVFAEGAKPNDAQIAHIAYTAGQLDIAAAEQAKQKSNNKDVVAFADDTERESARGRFIK